jgi:hypothetical protein
LRRNKIDADSPRTATWAPHALGTLKLVKNNRHYVLSEDTPQTKALAATLVAWQRKRAAEGKMLVEQRDADGAQNFAQKQPSISCSMSRTNLAVSRMLD